MSFLKKLLPGIVLGTLLILAACGGSEDEGTTGDSNGEEKGEVKIGLNNWAENIAVSNMWKVILEDHGYTVDLNKVEKGPLYEALKSEDLDVGLEIWLPHTDKPFYDKYKEDMDFHKDQTWFEGTTLGLAVPEYVDVNSIEELKGNADKFNGKIVGIDAGSSLVALTKETIKEYGLDNYELQTSSGPVMTAELGKAIKNEEPILVTLWRPHWVFAEYNVKFLEDSKKVYGEEENISWASRKGFTEDMPKVTKALNEWKMTSEELGSLMNVIKEEGDPLKGAEKWVKDNQDLIEKWTGSLEK